MTRFSLLPALVLVPTFAATTPADEAARGLALGSVVPSLSLRDTRGEAHELSQYDGQKAIVLAFTGVGCPIGEQYASRLQEIAARYAERGVVLLGVNANHQDTLPEVRAFANEFGLRFAILKDHDHRLADLLGAERTTEVFVLDGERRLRYRGRIDDQYAIGDRSVGLRKDRPEREFLTDALNALLAGEPVAVAETEPLGCVIGRTPREKAGAKVTFHEDVEPILQRSCQSCHREGQIAPFSLMSYDDAAGWAGMMAEVVENRRMPPWHADPGYGRFSNDQSLSEEEIATIVAWSRGGAPRGDAANAPPPVLFPDAWQIGEPDAVYEMAREFEVPATGTVPYQYFTVETGLEEDRWVRAIEVRPGNRECVHHILVFAVDPKNPRAWRRETRGGVNGYFAGMVPGERPAIYPRGMAKRLPAGATLIFQVHYTTNGSPQRDRSRIGLVFTDEPIEHELRTRSAAEVRGLWIPADAEAHGVKAYHRFERDTTLVSLSPHMHLRGSAFEYVAHSPASAVLSRAPSRGVIPDELGRRVSYRLADDTLYWHGEIPDEVYAALEKDYMDEADRAALRALRESARSEVLLRVSKYDFGWQNVYRLVEPKRLPAGTLLECTATYNNSASNPALTRELWSEPVRWGEQTWEEMLIGYFDCYEDRG